MTAASAKCGPPVWWLSVTGLAMNKWCTWIVTEPNGDNSTWIRATIGGRGECNAEARYRRSIGQPAEVLPFTKGASASLIEARMARVDLPNVGVQ